MALTKVEQLRQKYVTAKINLVDLIRLFDPTKNRLLTDLLMQQYLQDNANKEYPISDRIWNRLNFDTKEDEQVFRTNYTMYIMMDMLHSILGEDTFYFLERFNKYWIENKLPERDITAYKSLEDIKNVVHILDLEEYTKEKSVQIHKVYETDEWLIIAPLSLKASQIYGSGTKWCTTQRDNTYAFWQYTRDGFLLYIINKKTNVKYAYHRVINFNEKKEPGQVSSEFFNAADSRVDSIDLDMPFFLYNIIRQFVLKSNQSGIYANSDFSNYDVDGYREFQEQNEKSMPTPDDRPRGVLRVVQENPTDVDAPAIVPVEKPARGNVAEIMDDIHDIESKSDSAPMPVTQAGGGGLARA
jgi:hypothetical protein